ncbi:hypothetical protein INT43_008712 [Umbelopsis isabellina]|uniref:Ribosome biogenesis protein NOP53 n=1 Tax=Mortierella isabellina TaxID=91625 RepID=A0A8H7UFI6_MORIS|nr:hypothetical protein INT43_008712 [Umbelopsis isabellina]
MPVKQKNAQPSRKGKKAWRKNIDITDVEEHLEGVRSEERAGGKISERANDKLFTLDVKGDDRVKRQLAKDKPLYIDQILKSRSAIPAVGTRLFALPKESAKDNKGKESRINREKIEKLAKRKITQAPVKPAKKSKGTAYDVWADEEPTPVDLNPYLEPVRKRTVHAPSTLKVKPAAAEHQPAVEVAEAGASYNPTMEDHQVLLRKAHKVETDKISQRENVNKQLEYRKELLDLNEEEAVDSEVDEESDAHSDDDEETRKRKENKKKTRSERNRLKKAKETQQLELRRKQEKELHKEITKLEEIEKIVEESEMSSLTKAEKRKAKKEAQEQAGLPRLGKYFVQKAPIEVQLTDELSESLRSLKPEGNAFRDRFVSLQKRNIIEPRLPVNHKRRYRLKEYEKHSYKKFDRAQNKK